jgi:hypothetical protein
MEKFSKIIDKKRISIKIPVFPYLLDHQFMGKPVLPGVEAMRILVDSIQPHISNIENARIINGTFDKFLFMNPHEKHVKAFNDFEVDEKGNIQTKLVTRFQSGKSSMSRFIEHVTIHLSFSAQTLEKKPFDPGSLLSKDSFEISPDVIYKDLIPFGPAYQNIRKSIYMNRNGAIATVFGGDPFELKNNCLGSPFVLDAAFHVACAWGQRYHHLVAFPVGLGERHIFNPTCFGKTYVTLVKPVHADKTLLVFDILIYGQDGTAHEIISGVRMRDISAGKLKPPSWILSTS